MRNEIWIRFRKIQIVRMKLNGWHSYSFYVTFILFLYLSTFWRIKFIYIESHDTMSLALMSQSDVDVMRTVTATILKNYLDDCVPFAFNLQICFIDPVII